MSEELNELKQQATELGITYSPNIGEAKLKEKIEAYYESQETSSQELEKLVEQAAQIEANKEEASVRKAPTSFRALAKELEAAAKKTRIIKVVDNDQRVNNHTTTFTVTCENEYFDLGTKVYPLNEWIEVRQGHIDTLLEVEISQHVRDPENPALNRRVTRNRYSVSFKD
jgi:hypothetical protein